MYELLLSDLLQWIIGGTTKSCIVLVGKKQKA